MTTPILALDEWEEAQAQPNILVNEALRWLEAFAPLVVQSLSVSSPPTGGDGDRYIVGPAPTGAWAGHADEIALYLGSAWAFREAPEGTSAWVLDDANTVRYLAGVWA